METDPDQMPINTYSRSHDLYSFANYYWNEAVCGLEQDHSLSLCQWESSNISRSRFAPTLEQLQQHREIRSFSYSRQAGKWPGKWDDIQAAGSEVQFCSFATEKLPPASGICTSKPASSSLLSYNWSRRWAGWFSSQSAGYVQFFLNIKLQWKYFSHWGVILRIWIAIIIQLLLKSL